LADAAAFGLLAGGALLGVFAALFAFDAGGLRSRLFSARSIRSLAVLPLENLSGDPSQEFFADGMTEELINRLAQVGALRVTSRSSVMVFKQAKLTIPEIARRLKVDAVIEGSVRRSGERVKITVELVQAAIDRNLWGNSYERSMDDVFALQSDVAQAVTREIRVNLTPGERKRVAASHRVEPLAHEEYLKGRYYGSQFTRDGFLKSLDHYRRAIEIDPAFALAHAGIADTYAGMSTTFMAPDTAIPRVAASAARALELDPELADAYADRGYVKAFYDWKWAEGEADIRRAIDLNPGIAWPHALYGYLLAVNGRNDESISEMAKAHEIDPLSGLISAMQLWPLYEGRRYEQAIAAAQAIIRDDSTAWDAHRVLSQAHLMRGEFAQAVAADRAVRRALGDTTRQSPLLISALASQGERQQALHELETLLHKGAESNYEMGLLYGQLGMNDEAFAWLERDMRARLESVIWLKVDPRADPLRSDPRFGVLLKRLGLAG